MVADRINFNEPYLCGNELAYINDAVERKHISGNGYYSKKCQNFFEQNFGFGKCLLTTSCTDALEMVALLLDIKAGDEIILPAYTFVSTANAFALRGAELVFVDSTKDHPRISIQAILEAITEKTKAVVVVHYAGAPCEIDSLVATCKQKGIFIIEDAAQAINVSYKGKYLGAWGDFSTFSFHETKNIQCGEGGMLVLNNPRFFERAEIIWEKGTNRQAFFRGQVDKYRWVDLGSSFLASDLNAAYLYAQLEKLDFVHQARLNIWHYYYNGLSDLRNKGLINFPDKALCGNGHLFFFTVENLEMRESMLEFLSNEGIMALFHYQALHKSPYYLMKKEYQPLTNAEFFEDCLIRLPLHMGLENSSLASITKAVNDFFNNQ